MDGIIYRAELDSIEFFYIRNRPKDAVFYRIISRYLDISNFLVQFR